jgi:hypothetical protein
MRKGKAGKGGGRGEEKGASRDGRAGQPADRGRPAAETEVPAMQVELRREVMTREDLGAANWGLLRRKPGERAAAAAAATAAAAAKECCGTIARQAVLLSV